MAQKCKCCTHPGVKEIDLALASKATHETIIKSMKAKYPEAKLLNSANLSMHYANHVLTRPVLVDEIDVTTGEMKQAFITSHLSSAPIISKEAIPQSTDRVDFTDALAVILNIGVWKALNDPGFVTPALFQAALEMARKAGFNAKEAEEFAEAWKLVNDKKEASRKKTVKRSVTVEEETTVEEPEAIDGEFSVNDLEWPKLERKDYVNGTELEGNTVFTSSRRSEESPA